MVRLVSDLHVLAQKAWIFLAHLPALESIVGSAIAAAAAALAGKCRLKCSQMQKQKNRRTAKCASFVLLQHMTLERDGER